MGDSPAAVGSSFFRRWILPFLFLGGVAAVPAFFMWRFGDWSFPTAFALVLGGLIAVGAYLLGVFAVYERAATQRGWSCVTGPQETPEGVHGGVDIVIRGEHEGRAFVLCRQKSSSSGQRVVFSSVLVWPANETRMPEFVLEVGSGIDSFLDNVTGAGRMVEVLSGALGKPHVPKVDLEPGSKLAGRAKLRATDGPAAQAFFHLSRCDEIHRLVGEATIESAGGRLAIREKGFPMPWALGAFVVKGQEVRRALAQ